MRRAPASLPPDLDEIRRAVGILFDAGQVFELRIPKADRSGTVSGYFDDPETLIQAVSKWNGRAPGLYVSLNQVKPELLARAANRAVERATVTTSDDDVIRLRWLPLDFDAVRPAGISSTDREHESAGRTATQAVDFLTDTVGVPRQSILLGDSGNGAHVLARIDLPNTAHARDLVRRCIHAVADMFSSQEVVVDRSVGNPSRIWRLPGTLCAKGDDTPNRPHRVARILQAPESAVVCPAEHLEALAEMVPPQGREAGSGQADREAVSDLEAQLREAGMEISRVKQLGSGTLLELSRCPWNPEHVDTARVIVFASGALSAGCFHASCQGRSWRDLKPLLQGDASQALERPTPPISPAAPPEPLWKPGNLLTADERDVVESLDTFPRRFASYAMRRTDAPGSFLEAAGFAILSVAIGRKAALPLSIGTILPCLWVMLVADSTRMRKSTVLNLATEVLEVGRLDVLAPDDFSPQRLVTLMAERNRKPTLFRRDEFGGFYEGLNKLEHQAGGKQVLVSMYDGRNYLKELQGVKVIDKDTGEVKRNPEVVKVEDPFLSIVAGAQEDLLLSQAQVGDIFSGFLPRFSFIVPPAAADRRDVGEMSAELEAKRASLGEELRGLSSVAPKVLRPEPGALARWNGYQRDLEDEAEKAPAPSIAGPVFTRHGVTALKLALALAFADDADAVELTHVLAGIEVAERWRAHSYALLSRIGPTREEKLLEKVVALVRRKPGSRRGQVMSALRLSAQDMTRVKETLVQREWVTVETRGKGEEYWPRTEPSLEILERLSRPVAERVAARNADSKAEGRTQGPDKRSSGASDPSTDEQLGLPEVHLEEEPPDDVGKV